MGEKGKLLIMALAKFVSGLLVMGLLLFLPGGWGYQKGWLLMEVLFVPMLLAGLVMFVKSPELLQKRLTLREEESEQKAVIAYSGLMFVLCFVLAGLNERFGWLPLPMWVSIAAAAVFLLGYLLFARVLMENAYLSRSVEVQEGQKVVDTGLYGLVRHPMYLATLLLFWAMPWVLGSAVSFVPMLGYLPIIAKRIRNEEEVLVRGLPGYEEYRKKVRFRLIPGVW